MGMPNPHFINYIESIYETPKNQYAIAYWVPIVLREKVLSTYREEGIPIKIRFRGSRAASVGREMPCIEAGRTYRRTRSQANQDCLMADATHFSVYRRRTYHV